ncbi:MFS transporter [Barrientosiimonas marina]|uniref:MFS transporter n=1 Tax=Lentibacillus kimchii TaxID=1542911 RepID=A0ABW2UYG9_9BACI
MTPTKLWNKDFIIVSLSNLFLYFIFYLLISTISVFAINQFDASTSQAGFAAGAFVIGMLIARVFAGRYVDSFGPKKMLYLGFIFTVITTFFYFAAGNLTMLYIVRILHGGSLGIAITATGAIVARIVPPEKHGEGIGYYALSIPLGAAIGPLLGMFITQHAPFDVNFILCAGLVIISFLFSLFLKVPNVALTDEQLDEKEGFKLSNFFESKALPIAIIALFVGTGYSSIISFLNSYAINLDLVDMASFFFIFYAAATVVSRPFVGRWFDLKGENVVMYPAFIAFAIGLAVLSQADIAGWFILLAGIFVGLGYGSFISSGQAIAVKNAQKHRAGLATSTFYIFLDGGAGVGPSVLGLFIPMLGFPGLYLTMAGLVIISGILYYMLHGRKKSAVQHTGYQEAS